MLTAYLDESWDQHQQKILVIGGMIGHYREWSKIEWPWKTLLDKYGIEHDRASDAEFARGQFGKEPFRTPNISTTPALYKILHKVRESTVLQPLIPVNWNKRNMNGILNDAVNRTRGVCG